MQHQDIRERVKRIARKLWAVLRSVRLESVYIIWEPRDCYWGVYIGEARWFSDERSSRTVFLVPIPTIVLALTFTWDRWVHGIGYQTRTRQRSMALYTFVKTDGDPLMWRLSIRDIDMGTARRMSEWSGLRDNPGPIDDQDRLPR